jgi:integrase
MRKMEVCGLSIERVDFDARRIYVEGQWDDRRGERPSKWGSDRAVPLCRPLADALRVRAELVASGPLWLDPDSSTPRRRSAGERPKHQSWHATRHTFSTMLDQAGVREVVIEEIMGHRPGSVSRLYRHSLERDIDAVVDLLDGIWIAALTAEIEPAIAVRS